MTKRSPQRLPASNPEKKPFDPEVLARTVIAIPLLRDLKKNASKRFDIIIDLNLDYPGGRAAAKEQVLDLVNKAAPNLARIDRRGETLERFGFPPLAAMVGIFSEQALLKLKEIAETLLSKPAEGRRGRTSTIAMMSSDLPLEKRTMNAYDLSVGRLTEGL